MAPTGESLADFKNIILKKWGVVKFFSSLEEVSNIGF
jgi:hypothetical protein